MNIRFKSLLLLLPLLTAISAAGTVETGMIVVAESPDLRGFGWVEPEVFRGRLICWIGEEEADLTLVCGPPADRTLEITCAPLVIHSALQSVGVFINYRYAGQFVCPPDPRYRVYTVTVPAGLWHEGANILTLRTGYLKTMPPDPRELGLAVEKIRWYE